jgi:hypothetical protein
LSTPTVREVAVQIDAPPVLASSRVGSVGVHVGNEPEVEITRQSPPTKSPHDRFSRTFVAVDAADDQHLVVTRGITEPYRNDRPVSYRFTDLVSSGWSRGREKQQKGGDQ